MQEKMLFKSQEYEYITSEYEKIVHNCQKATEIDPKNAEAWHYYSSTNEEATLYYSRLFSKE